VRLALRRGGRLGGLDRGRPLQRLREVAAEQERAARRGEDQGQPLVVAGVDPLQHTGHDQEDPERQ
jgi:hypothetical protein